MSLRALVLLLGTFVVSHSAVAEAQTNLIVNGDAEADVGGDGFTLVSPTGWTDTNGVTVVQYGSAGGFPDANSTGPTNRGNNFFSGGPNQAGLPTASLSQTIDVSSQATEIDGGAEPFTLCGFLGGFSVQDDNVIATATFEDGMSQPTGSEATIGPVLANDRNDSTGMCLSSTSGIVPAGTRKVVVTVAFNLTAGIYIDGYADNLDFLLAATCPETGDSCISPTTTTSSTTSTSSTSPSTTTTTSTTSTTTTSTSTISTISTTTTTSTTTTVTLATTSTAPVPTTTTALATTTTASTTSTTARAPTTTTTTLPGGACDREPVAPTFASIDCRLEGLIGRIRSSTDIGRQQGPLVDQLTKAAARKENGESLCRSSDAKHARRRLKQAIRKMTQYGQRLRSRTSRRSMPAELQAELIAAGDAIKTDLRSLRGMLRCPDDALGR